MLRVQCPHCQSLLSVAAVPPGGQVGCPQCGKVMMLASPAAPPPKVAKPAPGKRKSAPHDDYEERRPKGKRKQNNNLTPLLIGGGIGLAALIIIGVVLIFALKGTEKPPAVAQGNKSNRSLIREQPPEQEVPPSPVRRNTPPPEEKKPQEPDNTDTSKEDKSSGGSTSTSDAASDNTVQPPSYGGSQDGSGADVFPYVLKSATFILAVTKDGQHLAAGSGSLIDRKNRLVLTNHHVAGDSPRIAVFFPVYEKGKLVSAKDKFKDQFNQRKNIIEAKVISTNPSCDLCILQLSHLPAGVEALPFAKQSCRVGERVHSIGNPGSSGALWVYAPGNVRQIFHHAWRTKNDDNTLTNHDAEIIETQSPTNHGDSGGPLVNDRGELVGVTHGGRTDGISSISVFIDVSEVKRFVENGVQEKLNQTFVVDSRAPLHVGGSVSGGGGMGGSLADLIKALSDADSSKRTKAVEALGNMGEKARDAFPALLKLLADPDDVVRRITLTSLNKIGLPAKSDLLMLVAGLSDSNVDMRRYAASTLEKMGNDASGAANDLIGALRDSDALVRQSAARTLGLLGRNVVDTAKAPLEAMLKDGDRDNRLAAAEGLAGIYATSGNLEGLMKLLKHADTDMRMQAAKACAKMGKNAKSVLPELLNMAKDDSGEIRKSVIKVLAQLDPNDAKAGITVVLVALKTGDKETKLACLNMLGNNAREVQAPWVVAVKECAKDPELKLPSIDALKKFAPASKASLGVLVELMKEEDTTVNEAALKAITDLGPTAAPAVGEMIRLMDISGDRVTENDEARVNKYASVVAKMGKPAVTRLRQELNRLSKTRWGCVKALGEMGPTAREALPELRGLLQIEPNDFIRKDIQDAIQKIMGQ